MHVIDQHSWMLPICHVRKGDRIRLNKEDSWARDLVVRSSNYHHRIDDVDGITYESGREIWTQKHENEWDWSKYDTYGPQPNDDWDPNGPELIWPSDCVNVHYFNDDEKLIEVYNDNPQLIDPITLTPYRWFVNVYELDRAYGGPEEGGWWYDVGTLRASYPAATYDLGKLLQNRVENIWKSEGNLYSVAYSGGVYGVSLEEHAGRDFPSRTPIYC